MGTRNLIMVVLNGEYKIAQYGQFDGYPSGQGVEVLKFLKEVDLTKFKNIVKNVKFLSSSDIDKINASIDEDGKINGKSWQIIYPELSRDTAAYILSLVYGKDGNVLLKNSLDFAADSLFCEWAYLIDLDKDIFEIYIGFNKAPLTKADRFEFLSAKSEGGYYPIKLLKTYPFKNLPTRESFIEELEKGLI